MAIIKAKIETNTGIISRRITQTTTTGGGIPSAGTNRLDSLLDVVATNEVNGGVPVYHADIDKYVIEPISANIVFTGGGIDGGNF